jgi:hypothetical protein
MAKKKMARKKTNPSREVAETTVTRRTVVKPKPVTDVITEKTYVTTAPEVEIRRPATLAQALTQPAVAVVKPRTKVRKVVERKTRAA